MKKKEILLLSERFRNVKEVDAFIKMTKLKPKNIDGVILLWKEEV